MMNASGQHTGMPAGWVGRLGHLLRAYPTLLRVGFAEMVAYRAEFFIWILTTNLPLVMLGLWTAVAADGPVGRFGKQEFVAYFLGMLVVRIVTGSWLVWELTMDIRQGTLSTRLLRPLHPLFAYSAQHLAAVPLRMLVVSPLLVVIVLTTDVDLPFRDPARLGLLTLAIAGAWLLFFFTMVVIGTLALYLESALSLFELWLGINTILSGYLAPLELLPGWLAAVARVLPFWYMLGFPVELLIGLRTPTETLRLLGMQWAFVALLFGLAMLVWRRGMRRFVAFGS